MLRAIAEDVIRRQSGASNERNESPAIRTRFAKERWAGHIARNAKIIKMFKKRGFVKKSVITWPNAKSKTHVFIRYWK